MNTEAQCTPSRSSIMTGGYAIRSGTHSVPFGGVADGLTQWEVTMAKSLSAAGYGTALYGKWHLGSQGGRLPNDQGFDEWYGIPRTTDEATWPGSVGYSPTIMPPEQIMEGRRGEKSRNVKIYDIEQRRLIDAEITRRSIALMERQSQARKPFLTYATLTAAASADAAQSGVCRQDRQRRLGRHASRDGSQCRADAGCGGSPRHSRQHHRGLRERQRAGVHQAVGRLGGAVARPILHRVGRRHPCAVHDPLARPDSRRTRQ